MIGNKHQVYIRENIPFDIEKNTILNIFTNCVTNYTHGFHKYPAKFIPNIPRWAIDKYLGTQKDKLVFDPFCGSGTTLVEGLLAGHNVIGIDIDPLSAMIAKVKTTPVDISQLAIICHWIAAEIEKQGREGTFKPACTNINHWFTADAITKLSLIRTLIDEIPERFGHSRQNNDISDLLLICFSSIIRRVSNADNESQKTYVSHTKIKEPEETISLFLQQLNFYKERIAQFSLHVNHKLSRHILCSSSTEGLKTKLEGRTIDLVVTSPPYIKAIDYIYNQMVELFWIGDLFDMQTQTKQNGKKEYYIGTKHLPKRKYTEYTPFRSTLGINKLDEKLQEVYEKDPKNGHKHAYIAFKYFTDMEKHFAEIVRYLNPNTHYVVVVGDCSVSGVSFETADFLIDIAERNGFSITNKWGYQIKAEDDGIVIAAKVTTDVFTTGVWYMLEFKYVQSATVGGVAFWIDGIEETGGLLGAFNSNTSYQVNR
ncbi:MAG: site-specific DNA-methyltransferase, partial [candidate division Zixibacteria bacterium]|nr:site-specific DNA-methyltransferase [candidate division Zixibacteria bacterium]